MKRIAITVIVLVLSACSLNKLMVAQLEKPTFTYVACEPVEVSQSRMVLIFRFIAHNPNDVGLKNVLVSYELSSEGNKLMRGDDIPLALRAKGDTELTVPAVIEHADLAPLLALALKQLLSGAQTMPITINAVLSGKPAVLDKAGEEHSITFEQQITKTVDVPLPVDKLRNLKNRLRDAIKSRTNGFGEQAKCYHKYIPKTAIEILDNLPNAPII